MYVCMYAYINYINIYIYIYIYIYIIWLYVIYNIWRVCHILHYYWLCPDILNCVLVALYLFIIQQNH